VVLKQNLINQYVNNKREHRACIGLPKSKHINAKRQTHRFAKAQTHWFAKAQAHWFILDCQSPNTLVYIGLPKRKHIGLPFGKHIGLPKRKHIGLYWIAKA
jgi:hypothetical protein